MRSSILLLLFITAGYAAECQSHTYKIGCRYFKLPPKKTGEVRVAAEAGCAGCNKERDDENKARQVENKRRADVAVAEEKIRAEKIRAEKAEREAREKMEAEREKQRAEAEKEFEAYSKDQQKYIDNLKIDIDKRYPGYDAAKASQKIPVRMKLLKLVENKFAKAFELYSGETLVRSFGQERYWVSQLHKDLPYFILNERDKNLNKLSLIDSKGEPMTISGERNFESIVFNDKNNTIQLILALNEKELLDDDGCTCETSINGDYISKSVAQRVLNVLKLERERSRNNPAPTETRSNPRDMGTAKIAGFGKPYYGQSTKRIVAGIDLLVLSNQTVYTLW